MAFLVVAEPPGVWQQRQWAHEIGEGVSEVTQSFPQVGLYRVMLQISSRGVGFPDLPFTEVTVLSDAQSIDQ
jgi:hypothetical protein